MFCGIFYSGGISMLWDDMREVRFVLSGSGAVLSLACARPGDSFYKNRHINKFKNNKKMLDEAVSL